MVLRMDAVRFLGVFRNQVSLTISSSLFGLGSGVLPSYRALVIDVCGLAIMLGRRVLTSSAESKICSGVRSSCRNHQSPRRGHSLSTYMRIERIPRY